MQSEWKIWSRLRGSHDVCRNEAGGRWQTACVISQTFWKSIQINTMNNYNNNRAIRRRTHEHVQFIDVVDRKLGAALSSFLCRHARFG